jgi:hypothetical protein
MGKKRKEERIDYEHLLNAVERFVDEIGMEERNFEAFCRGVMIMLHHLPVNQFKAPKHKKRKGNVVPFRRV